MTILSTAIFPHHRDERERERETRSLTYKLSIDEIIHRLSCYGMDRVYGDKRIYKVSANIHQRRKLRKWLLAVSVTRDQ